MCIGMIRKLLPCLGTYKKYAILTPLMILIEVLLEVWIPWIMASIVDHGIQGNGGIGYTVKMGMLMIGMACCSLFFGALSGKFAAQAGIGFGKNLRSLLFSKVQEFSFINVDKFTTGSLVTRLTTDVTNTQNAFMLLLRLAFRAPIMLIGATCMAVYVNPRLSLIFFAAIPFLSIALYFILIKAHPRFLTMLKNYDSMNSIVQENLINIRVVKSFVREDYEKQKFTASAEAVRIAQFFAEKLVILNMPLMEICMYCCIIAVLWFGGSLVINSAMEIGELSSFISYIMQILISLMMISMLMIISVLSRASLGRISEIIDEHPSIHDNKATYAAPLNGSIEFRDVSFAYDELSPNLVLSHINLKIKAGETIGILGGTGSGKSTLVQLIPRLYETSSGQVFVDGKDVKKYRLPALRDTVAMVLQKNLVFSGTIRENLCWGKKNATEAEITAACKAAQAHDFIMQWPNNYDTVLGQNGVNVSGGQKQRLCIARALLKNPKIIIFDDSTSAIDTATENQLRKALKEQVQHATTIIIAQRISSLTDADRIIVMDDGKIDAFGSHEELLQTNKIYQEVYKSQQKGVS